VTDVAASAAFWALDSSTFIHALLVGRLWLLPRVRAPLRIPEYVLRTELNAEAHADTAEHAKGFLSAGHAVVCRLSLADLDRIAEIGSPRRIGLGEIACAVIAERDSGGVLLDDWRGRRWLEQRLSVTFWESIEDVLLLAASRGHISEFDLDECEERLRKNRYDCRVSLRNEHLRRLLNR
jgi:hypothetical protein